MKQSVRDRANEVPAPPVELARLSDRGAQLYDEMCAVCHGAPGFEPREVGKGLRPQPPDLSKSVPARPDRELFWIVKHGVRLTRMPAWGETHDDRQIWTVVAFLKQLPSLSAEGYRQVHDGGSSTRAKPGQHVVPGL